MTNIIVLWDFENCRLSKKQHAPKAEDVMDHLVTIAKDVLRFTSVSMKAVGDTTILSKPQREGLHSRAVQVTDIPLSPKKNSADIGIISILCRLFFEDPPTATEGILLISGDGDYSNMMHRISQNGYLVALAVQPATASRALVSSAKFVWDWDKLVIGKRLRRPYIALQPLLDPRPRPQPVEDVPGESDSNEDIPGETDSGQDSSEEIDSIQIPRSSRIELTEEEHRGGSGIRRKPSSVVRKPLPWFRVTMMLVTLVFIIVMEDDDYMFQNM